MAAINDLISQIQDETLRNRIQEEVSKMAKQKKFGLVFEEHMPESTPLYDMPIKRGCNVMRRDSKDDKSIYVVLRVEGDTAVCVKPEQKDEAVTFDLKDIVRVAEFGESIYPYLKPLDSVCNAPDSDLWHTLIEADNYHALQLLEYLYAGKVDCIYIDPPYNTGAKDWKYNNDYVDGSDAYRHSKWLSFMQRRLKLAKKLLNPKDSVLIVTIDEKEYLHLGCLLEEMFPEARLQMITSMTNKKGSTRQGAFCRRDEYLYILFFGEMTISKSNDDMISSEIKNSSARKVLISLPATLRKQWEVELLEKFGRQAVILDRYTVEHDLANVQTHLGNADEVSIVIASYDYSSKLIKRFPHVKWDFLIIDEAHNLRNVFHGTKRAKNLYDLTHGIPKILLTATPLQNSLTDLHGLVSFIDPRIFGSEKVFNRRFVDGCDYEELKQELLPVLYRTLRRDVGKYMAFSKRTCITVDFHLSAEEKELYDVTNDFLRRDPLYSIPNANRGLIILVIRKLLASSSFALIETFEVLEKRLEKLYEGTKSAYAQEGFDLFWGFVEDEIDEDGFNEYDDEETAEKKQAIQAELKIVRHTFAHLLIKQMSMSSGYSSSAIRERIYFGDDMSGVLLYTGSADKEGSLGGLVELGNIDQLIVLMKDAFQEALVCTNDPECLNNVPAGNNSNGAACHSCCMISETACENGNRMLDRGLIVPIDGRENQSYFKTLVEELCQLEV